MDIFGECYSASPQLSPISTSFIINDIERHKIGYIRSKSNKYWKIKTIIPKLQIPALVTKIYHFSSYLYMILFVKKKESFGFSKEYLHFLALMRK